MNNSVTSIKDIVKKIPPVYTLNSVIKAKCQEKLAERELEFYRKRVPGGTEIYNDSYVSELLSERLAKRGIKPIKKVKGDLHIYLIYYLFNWEFILPVALKEYGMISEFELKQNGFLLNTDDWIKHRSTLNKKLIDHFNRTNSRKQIDIVVSYNSGYTCDPSVLEEMAKKGTVIFNFWWDDKLGFRGKRINGHLTGPAAIASSVDLNLTNAPDSVIKYFGEGGLSIFWPEAAHPQIHKPCNIPFEYDVTVLGGNYGWRPLFIKNLQKKGIKISCFGKGWEGGTLTDEESIRLFSKSRINLGFSGVGHSRKLMCIKGRDFEVPMSGGLYLTQHNPELSLVYNIGKEIITYKNEEDCYQKICWLLENPDIAENIRREGRERALSDHTWQKRFDKVFSIAGFL